MTSGFSQQKIQGSVFQIAEVQNSSAAFCGRELQVKFCYQRQQTPHTGTGLLEILLNLLKVIGKILQLFFQPFFTGISGSFYPVCQFRIRIFSWKGKSSIIDIRSCHDGIPVICLMKNFQLPEGLFDIGSSFLHAFRLM